MASAPRRRLAAGDANHIAPRPALRGRTVANGGHQTARPLRQRGGTVSGDGVTALVGTRQRATTGERAALADLRYRLGR